MNEIWNPTSYDGYEVSTLGRVKSFHGRWGKGTPCILKQRIVRGYPCVNLWKDGKLKTVRVHRLVAEAFVPNPEDKPQVNHIDGNKLNNHVDNLEWSTPAENMQHAFDTSLNVAAQGCDDSQAFFKDEATIIYIRDNPDGLTTYQLADLFDCSTQMISAIQLGKKYQNCGGQIREAKFHPKAVSDEDRAAIKADYQKGVRGHGCEALAQKYGYNHDTIWRIVHED